MSSCPNPEFWRGKRVLVTGHTGFKGSWLSIWLKCLGARVAGVALRPATDPSLYELANVAGGMASEFTDIREGGGVWAAIRKYRPEIVMHLAAQPLVGLSYREPVATYATNVMGTVNVLEAVRHSDCVRVVVVVTSDKCYENRNLDRGYRESDAMGGHDPYSSSKGCAELVTAAYARSFFCGSDHGGIQRGWGSVRAGNVVGGGDWSADRLVPDLIRAFERGEAAVLRRPLAVRPWQHVLEPLAGYLRLAECLWESPSDYWGGWNFGPDEGDALAVEAVARLAAEAWGGGAVWRVADDAEFHEAQILRLDSTKAQRQLDWRPVWTIDRCLKETVEWYRAARSGAAAALCEEQIESYCQDALGQAGTAASA